MWYALQYSQPQSVAYVDLTAAVQDGNTALHYAAMLGYVRVVRQLVAGGAKIHVLNKKGQSPAQAALTDGVRSLISDSQ